MVENNLYFLIINGEIIKVEKDGYNSLLNYLAENYQISLRNFGCLTKEEIRECEYMDIHSGLLFFIDDEFIDEKPANIYIMNSWYCFEYQNTTEGRAVKEWIESLKREDIYEQNIRK